MLEVSFRQLSTASTVLPRYSSYALSHFGVRHNLLIHSVLSDPPAFRAMRAEPYNVLICIDLRLTLFSPLFWLS